MSKLTRRTLLKQAAGSAAASIAPQAFTQRYVGDDFIEKDATELASLIRAGHLTQLELVEIVIRRIEAMNPILNFMTNAAFERARRRAGKIPLDAPFAGVPILMKDMIDIGGLPRTDGSRLLLQNFPRKSVDYVKAVENSGLNIIGQTNVPEMASFVITNNDVFGATRNPWNLEYSVFASSGGSAAAVAAGVVPMAHGTDGAGSNRLPPSATGILGMKPSRGRILSGESNGQHDIAKTNQMLSRTVRDNALAFFLTQDNSGEPYPREAFIERASGRRLKIGLINDDNQLLTTDPEVLKAQHEAGLLLQSLGHSLEETDWPVNSIKMADAYLKFFAGKLGQLKQALDRASPGNTPMESGLLTPLLASYLESSQVYSPDDIHAGREFLQSLSGVFGRVFQEFDVLLAPVAPVAAPPLYEHTPDAIWTDDIAQYSAARLKFTSPINFAGCPAMSVPLNWGQDSGLPIGSQFIAAAGQDRLLYELAYELEEARPWKDKWAPHAIKHWM